MYLVPKRATTDSFIVEQHFPFKIFSFIEAQLPPDLPQHSLSLSLYPFSLYFLRHRIRSASRCPRRKWSLRNDHNKECMDEERRDEEPSDFFCAYIHSQDQIHCSICIVSLTIRLFILLLFYYIREMTWSRENWYHSPFPASKFPHEHCSTSSRYPKCITRKTRGKI